MHETCVMCHHANAQWILMWGNYSHQVHRHCGEALREFAPKGASVKLVPSDELKAERRRLSGTAKLGQLFPGLAALKTAAA